MITSFSGDYRFLSNFAPCDIKYKGEIYKSVEHAYQAAKFLDPDIRRIIRQANSPSEAKRLNKRYKPRDNWDKVKLKIMLKLLRRKFKHEEYRKLLIDTGNQQLIEGNWWGDTYWGICKGKGENN